MAFESGGSTESCSSAPSFRLAEWPEISFTASHETVALLRFRPSDDFLRFDRQASDDRHHEDDRLHGFLLLRARIRRE